MLAEPVGVLPAFIGHLAPGISKILSLDALFDIAAVLKVCLHTKFCFSKTSVHIIIT